MEQMIRALRILREEYRFNGYIHAKAIPGAAPELVHQLGLLADRLSVNIELPSQQGLQALAPDKTREAILRPMGLIRDGAAQSKAELVKYRHAPVFARRAEHTADRGRYRRQRPAHSAPDGVTVSQVQAEARVLLRVCTGGRK